MFRSRSPATTAAPPATLDPYGLTLVQSPQNPRVDLIFVHGLKGGSFKTWQNADSDNGKESTFWPGEWLPKEDGFEEVRIHTYGYDSDWAAVSLGNGSVLDFAKRMLGVIELDPTFTKSEVRKIWLGQVKRVN